MPHYLEGKVLSGNCIIRDSSVFAYMWAVLVSTIFCISCSDALPGIWSTKFWMPFFIMPRAPITTGITFVLSFHIFVTVVLRSLYLEGFWVSMKLLLLLLILLLLIMLL